MVIVAVLLLGALFVAYGNGGSFSVPFRGWWKPLAFRRREDLSKSPEGTRPPRLKPGVDLTLIAKSSKHENAKQPHWAQARSSCWGTRSPPL